MAALWRLTGWYKKQHLSEEIPAKPFRWLATLTAVSLGLGSNPGEDTDVCKCIVPSHFRDTLNNRRSASPLVRLVEGEERWEAPGIPEKEKWKH
ncbi:uncharacterized protein TNCV_4785451 [Trichonephila clavipes]|nr:uncharacterized protein TNCV_4785451 [Trichonephila clavipes]